MSSTIMKIEDGLAVEEIHPLLFPAGLRNFFSSLSPSQHKMENDEGLDVEERTPLVGRRGCSIVDEQAHGNKRAKRKLQLAIVLCSVFFLIELFAGIFSKSLALLSDAFHLLTDLAAFAISLVSIYLSSLPATSKFSFGYHRAEILGM